MKSLKTRALAVWGVLFVVIPVYAQAPVVSGTNFRTPSPTPVTQSLPRVVSSLDEDLGSKTRSKVSPASFEIGSSEPVSFAIGSDATDSRVVQANTSFALEAGCGIESFCGIENGCGIESVFIEEPGCGVESVVDCGGGGCCAWCDPCEVGRFWFDFGFMYWQRSGMKIPALVTGNPLGTSIGDIGILGADSTQVLLGNDPLLDDGSTGIRFGAGICLCPGWSFAGEYFFFDDDTQSVRFDSSSGMAIARPFINVSTNPHRYDTQLVSVPPGVDGFVNVDASSAFRGGSAMLRFDVGSRCWGDICNGCCPQVTGVRMSIGYRYLDLDEQLRITEQLIGAGDQFDIFDDFRTNSEFHGLQFGIDSGFRWSNNCINAFGRFAAGVNQNNVAISGGTTDIIAGQTTVRDSGILTQSSNIGTSDRNVAAMAAEVGINLRRQLTSCLSANVGYSVLYWSNVARAGEQIDLRVNPDLFPPPIVGAEGLGAQRTHAFSDFFAHGFNGGLTWVF